ncbi:hypothetical protein BKA67DRAFT_538961 [Truncatella angustata]|uniref:Peptidase S8/S53 domain-containing protein n=1 Tax=Truncatella angustata TaxID=152316 RepID=A0A9P8ZU73_9PEZI|nr:uncharacterized protein BKA67DRAFT_538961 [Truncatella angustata]KAH6648951.1 hypothetical protein BKA67DRAFT_538961 [Truncatella angustata]
MGIIFLPINPITAAGNTGGTIRSYPQLLWNDIPGMMVVGAIGLEGFDYEDNSKGYQVDTYAPGVDFPQPGGGLVESARGTPFATPMVAGLAAYLRARPQYGGSKLPTDVRQIIYDLERPLSFKNGGNQPNLIWDGQRGVTNCLGNVPSGEKRLSQQQSTVNDDSGDDFDDDFGEGGSCPYNSGSGNPGNNPMCIYASYEWRLTSNFLFQIERLTREFYSTPAFIIYISTNQHTSRFYQRHSNAHNNE